jgi:hypothetical protein
MFLCLQQTSPTTSNFIQVLDPLNCPSDSFIAEPIQTFLQTPTLYDLFTIPLATDLQQMFMIGFELPMIAYMSSWAFGTVINWVNQPDDKN